MEYIEVDREKTFFSSSFISSYYSNKLAAFHTYKPSISSLDSAIAAKSSFDQSKRDTLVAVLHKQYAEAEVLMDDRLKDRINSLGRQNCYTVTTGQQIHLGLGPLYVLYKILDILAIAKEFKLESPDNTFVPLFWMASEDHDLEEISEINIFGKSMKWETDQVGPLGRMSTAGVSELFTKMEQEFNWSQPQLAFIQKCISLYSNSKNLAVAFRLLLHEYFKETDLVILDADDEALKQSFMPVFEDEFLNKNAESLKKTTADLETKGYPQQLVVRDCNVFDMSTGDRLKINSKQEAPSNASDMSPNAALRPLYQEWIVPNLVYVGGPSEVKYWMQLKGMFDNYEMPVPILHLRKSNIIVPAKQVKIYSQESIKQLFDSVVKIANRNSEALRQVGESLDSQFNDIMQKIAAYDGHVQNLFPGFSLAAKRGKIEYKLLEIKGLVDAQMEYKIKEDPNLNKLLRIKSKYFDEALIQERSAHFVTLMDVIPMLVDSSISQFGLKKSQKIDVILT